MKKQKETFLLVSMKEDKAKRLAQVINSDTCRRILDFLAEKDATETDIAKELDMPLSTAHYNLQQLLNANLVNAEEFHYSEKGKEVLHYSLAKKFIVIAPDTKEGISVKIRQVLPAIGALLVGAVALHLLNNPVRFASRSVQSMVEADKVIATAPQAAPEALRVAKDAISSATSSAFPVNPVVWFVVGGTVVLIVILVTTLLSRN